MFRLDPILGEQEIAFLQKNGILRRLSEESSKYEQKNGTAAATGELKTKGTQNLKFASKICPTSPREKANKDNHLTVKVPAPLSARHSSQEEEGSPNLPHT